MVATARSSSVTHVPQHRPPMMRRTLKHHLCSSQQRRGEQRGVGAHSHPGGLGSVSRTPHCNRLSLVLARVTGPGLAHDIPLERNVPWALTGKQERRSLASMVCFPLRYSGYLGSPPGWRGILASPSLLSPPALTWKEIVHKTGKKHPLPHSSSAMSIIHFSLP